MYEAYRNDITADLDEDNLNTELVELLTSTSIPNMTGNQVSIYNSIKSNLYNQLVLINNFKSTGSLDMIELLNSTSVSNNSKLIITEVIEAIQSEPNIINNEGGFTNYLNDVEEIIKSEDFSDSEKTEILTFLSVVNSSLLFWKHNLPLE